MSKHTTPSQQKPQLARALEKNDAIQGTVERSAQELDLVNSVLEKEIPVAVKKGDIAMALEKTAELEDQIQASADELAHVNELLAQEITEREKLEEKLQNAENELAKKNSASRS
jgi:C4-dicarboxylate-specific signal transduction histidine kinase